MHDRHVLTALATASLVAVSPAQAQGESDIAAMRAELAAMRAQMQAMEAKIVGLEEQLAEANTETIPAPAASAKPGTTIDWDGAPRIEAVVDPKNPDAGKWSFKPRGRLQIDSGGVDSPGGIAGDSLGIATELRRAYLGFDGTLPGKISYRLEADFANSTVELTDAYIAYNGFDHVTLTMGQHKPFWGFEEITSDLFTSFMERAAFNSAFGFERRVGLSAAYQDKALLLQGGVFTDNAADLNSDSNNSYSIDLRAAFQPKLGDGRLHLGGSFHDRTFNDAASTTRYRARPFLRTPDLRLIDSRAFSASGERSLGLEAAWTSGRFHAAAESAWMTARRPGLSNPTFNGGYAEVGYFLTPNDTRPYKASDGSFNRIRPAKGLDKGGFGAVEVNARYDWLDLSDGAVIGGRQQIAAVSLLWVPTDYLRFILNYGHLWIDDAAVAARADRDYTVDSVGLRAQVDF